MSDFTLTDSQRRALDLSRNVAVTAGAGSGKTFVLVQRYLRTLEHNLKAGVRNVLAITFTERAAAEMKSRVRDSIEKKINDGSDAQMWSTILETFDRAAISTIHSFCASLLREFPVEAGIDPSFTMLDQPESERLRGMAVVDAIQEAAEPEGQFHDELHYLLRLWGRTRAQQNLLTLFNRSGSDVWAKLYAESSQAEILELNNSLIRQLRDPIHEKLFSDEMSARLSSFQCMKPEDKINLVRKSILGALRSGMEADDDKTLAKVLEKISAAKLLGGSTSSWDSLPGCKKLISVIREQARTLTKLIVGERDTLLTNALQAISRLYLRAQHIYSDSKGRGRMLDFDDLQTAALELLRANKNNIASELHERFAGVLVDEFQDTNNVQWEIIRRIVQSPDGELPPGKLFIVGDPKQSIYRFRNADITVFNRVKSDFIDPGGHVEMDENFRTLDRPVEFINNLSSKLMGTTSCDYDPQYSPLVCRRDSEGHSIIVELILPARSNQSEVPEPAEAELVARRILSFIQQKTPIFDSESKQWRPAQLRDVAILLQARTRLHTYESALRRYNIPFSVVGGFGFYQRQEVIDVVNLLSFLLYQSDDIALAGLLRSPIIGLSDDFLYDVSRVSGDGLWLKLLNAPIAFEGEAAKVAEAVVQRLQRWIVRAGRVPVEVMLANIFEETGLWGSQTPGDRGEQIFANMEKVLQLARIRPDLQGFVERLRELIDEGSKEGDAAVELEESDSVRILTIHAAKGLEFPIVFVVDTHHQLNWGGSDSLYFHPDYGFGIKMIGSDGVAGNTVLREIIKERILKEETAESIRLMYVALTRARDHLVISGTRTLDAPSISNTWLHYILDQSNLDYENPADSADVIVHVDHNRIKNETAEAPATLDEILKRYQEASESLGADAGKASPPLLLSTLEEAAPPLQLPVTAIGRYIHCPRAFHLGRMLTDDLLQDVSPTDDAVRTGGTEHAVPASLLGSIAHRLFEDILSIPQNAERDALLKYMKEASVTGKEEQQFIIRNVISMAEKFRTSEFGKEIFSADEFYCEVPFSLAIQDAKSQAGLISGKIDCLFRKSDVWTLVDYKTDTVSKDGIEENNDRHRMQILQYTLAARRLLGVDVLRAIIYYTRPAMACECSHSREELADTEAKIATVFRNIAADRFPARPACSIDCIFADQGFCARQQQSDPEQEQER